MAIDISSNIVKIRESDPQIANALRAIMDEVNRLESERAPDPQLSTPWFPHILIGGSDRANAPLQILPDGTILLNGTIISPGSIDTIHIAADAITANEIATGAVTADAMAANSILAVSIVAGEVVTSKLSVPIVVVVGLGITNNSPGAGSIAWTSCSVFVDGVEYPISSGNTSAPFVYWELGDTTFTAGTSYPVQPDFYPIATNVDGVHDIAWDKVGNQALQRQQLSFGLIEGVQLQPTASTTFNIIAGSFITSTLLEYTSPSEGGIHRFGLQVNTPDDDTVEISIAIDGEADNWIQIYNNGFTLDGRLMADNGAGDGTTAADYIAIPYGFGFTDSVIVKVRRKFNGAGSTGNYTAWVSSLLKP